MIENNDRVCLTYWPERTGIVTRAGPEQSEVRWTDDGIIENKTNENLKRISGSHVAYKSPSATANKPLAVKPGKSKLSDTWTATDLKITAKPGSVIYVQATLARKTLEIIKFQEEGGKLNYLSWLFRKGFIRKE